jgi:hypothetical protein
MNQRSISELSWPWQRLNRAHGRALVLFVLVAMLAAPAMAALHEITVIGVGIDSLRSKAEAKAIDYGKKRAVYLLSKKLGAVDSESTLAALKPDTLKDMVRGYTIIRRERSEDKTYIEMRVTIVDTPLRAVLGLPIAEESSSNFRRRGILVLPVFVATERPLLWEKRNPLSQPLKSLALKMGKGSVILPVGDPEDLRVVDYNNVLTIDYHRLKEMVARYGASEILIAVVTLGSPDTSEPTDILLRRLTKDQTKLERITLNPTNALDLPEARIQAAVVAIAQVATDLASSVAIEERKELAAAQQQPVEFVFITMREFGEMQAALRSFPGFKQLIITKSDLHRVEGVLYYTGHEKKLRAHLKKSAIFVRPGEKRWELNMR